jgi:hypothetical protein
VTNCSNNYGPYQFPEKLIPLFINNIRHRKPLPVYGKGENVRDWLFVEDHARAIDLIFHEGKIADTYNIGGFNEWKNIDIIKVVIKTVDRLLGRKEGEDMDLITFVTDRAGHDLRYAIDSSKLQRELGLDVAVCKTWEEVEIFERRVGPAVMKAPWSSSGKGLMMVSSPTSRGWMQTTVAREGAVVCERWMDRVQDFALEFTVEESGAVRYEGLSVFRTSPTGRYVAHDFVTPEEQRAALMQWVSEEEVLRWCVWWQKRLEAEDIRAFSYAGPMGVDMLVDADGKINPCVELNWRMTMGHVALLRGKNEQK